MTEQKCNLSISIHAPSRERPLSEHVDVSVTLFQSTLPHGSDSLSYKRLQGMGQFQSTLPHGSDTRPRQRDSRP